MRLRCLVAALAFLAAFASDSWGQSKHSTPPRDEAKTAQQATATDQRGTEQSPAIVKIIPTPKTAEEAEADRREKEQKDTNDIRLVVFTGLLFGVGFLQLLVFGWQGIQLKRSVSAAKEATNLARQEFTATHRPKIIIYGMETQSGDGSTADGRVHFRYVNAGDTDAFVTSISSHIVWTDKGMVRAGVELHPHDVIKRPVHVPSGNNGYAITTDKVDTIKLIRSGRNGHDTAYCVGVVVYRDTSDIERRTGFCRRYDSERERWLKVEDADYEYEY
jgi:hypothetical protein